jgi:hypothetical protein
MNWNLRRFAMGNKRRIMKAANRYETWIEKRAPGHIAAMRQMMAQFATQASKAGKAA